MHLRLGCPVPGFGKQARRGRDLSRRARRAPRPNYLSNLVSKLVKRAKLGKRGGCHMLRHSTATIMLERGTDIRFIQELLGDLEVSCRPRRVLGGREDARAAGCSAVPIHRPVCCSDSLGWAGQRARSVPPAPTTNPSTQQEACAERRAALQ